MKLPSSVRVGYRDFTITEWDRTEASDNPGGPFFGDCNVNRAAIRVCLDYGPQRAANTTLHEILHACWASAGLRDRETEERAVQALADQISQVWHDNPKLIAFLNANLGA